MREHVPSEQASDMLRFIVCYMTLDRRRTYRRAFHTRTIVVAWNICNHVIADPQ